MSGILGNCLLDDTPLSSGSGGNPPFSQVVLLAHGNGANNGTVFTDSSNNNYTLTASGSPITSTAQSKWGGGSIYLNGSSYLYVASGSPNFGSNNLTFECWCYPTSSSLSSANYQAIIGNAEGGTGGDAGLFLAINSGYFVFRHWTDGSHNATSTQTATANQWHFVRGVKSGQTITIYVDGTQGSSATLTETTIQQNPLTIGAVMNNSGFATSFQGYLNDVRMTNGTALNNTSVPTSQFPNS